MTGSVDAAALQTLYLDRFGGGSVSVTALRGDGSARRIYRLHGAGGSVVGISGDHAAENAAFIGFTRAFTRLALPVPEILAVAPDGLHYLEEDLGDVTLYSHLQSRRGSAGADRRVEDVPDDVFRLYTQALDDLVRFQYDGVDAVDFSLCYQDVRFGRDNMMFDLMYFRDMFVRRLRPGLLDESAFDLEAQRIADALDAVERRCFLYRDFQSRNIMVQGNRLRYIDYQSGRRGAPQYDVASLLYDAKARIPEVRRRALLDGYLGTAAAAAGMDAERFLETFDDFAVLRVLQALGAYGNLGHRQGKPGFLSSIPPALDNLPVLLDRSRILRDCPVLVRLLRTLADDPVLHALGEDA